MQIKFIISVFIVVLLSACAGVKPFQTPVSTPTDLLSSQQDPDLVYPPTLSENLPKDNLLLASHIYGSKVCFDIGIYNDNTYFIISCLTDFTYPTPAGTLDKNQSAYIHRWEERFASFEELEMHDLLKFFGRGVITPNYEEKLSMKAMLYDIEWAAHGYIHKGGLPSAVNISLIVLSNQLGTSLDHTNIYNFEVVDFPNSCLDAPKLGEVCEPIVTRGFRIYLMANNLMYEYHTDAFGYDIRSIGEPQTTPTQGAGG